MARYSNTTTISTTEKWGKNEYGQTVRQRLPSNRTVTRSRVDSYDNSKLLGLFVILIAMFILAPIVSGTVGDFTADRFGTYAEYAGYNPVLPHIQTVVETLGNVTPLPNPLTVFNYQLIVADWGIFEFLRSFLNVLLSPLAFTGQFFVSIFQFLSAVVSIFNIA